MSLDSNYIRTDVTAVTLHNDLVLAGIGCSMYVYSENSTKPRHRLVCLKGQKIYGFKRRNKDDCSLIVFGGKQFTIVLGPSAHSQDGPVVFTRLFEPVLCDDWLHSVAWTGEMEISVLTAHNVVQKYNSTTLALTSKHSSQDNSILYSGLLVALEEDVLVMAGTVYSEVILHLCGEKPLHRLTGHKGVIFSISCYPDKNIIVTTSDDRSIRIWGVNSPPQVRWTSIEYWRNEIACKHVLYGHHARVMRSSITDAHILSVGEDSCVCFWSHDGVLDKKLKRHQNAGIWSIDTHKKSFITGGGDGAVTIQSYSAKDNYHQSDVMNLGIDRPKHISYSASQNLYILTESNRFIYYNIKEGTESTATVNLIFNATFHALSVSPSRKMCAVAARKSVIQVALEVEKVGTDPSQMTVEILSVQLENETILSVNWAGNMHLVACSENGIITVITVTQKTVEPYTNFELPNCKERWLTCAATESIRNVFVLGDRCGGIHFYKEGSRNPLKSFSKLHGRYGPTSMLISHGQMITTGRDKTIKYFKIAEDELTHTGTKELDFYWVERFLDEDKKIVCGFRDKMFVVFNLRTNEILLEIPCGGGHRSWDVLYNHDSARLVLKLIYLKNSNINTESVILSTPVSVRRGSHSKEINCLKTHQIDGRTVFVSGGEDTTLRISCLDREMDYEDLDICKNLSSVRTLKVYAKNRDEMIVISAGGRAQMCIKLFNFIKTQAGIEVKTTDLVEYMLKGSDKDRKGALNWKSVSRDPEPETRIMDLDYIKLKEKYTIFAGCSDARVRVFLFNSDKLIFKLVKESKYLPTCILKTHCVNFLKHDILITCSTRGEVAFWDVTNEVKNGQSDFEPFFVTRTNKSGINSIATRNLSNNKILVATGGDDNALHIIVLTVPDCHNLTLMEVQHSLVLDKHHSSAITGLCLVGDCMLSTSIDQRITLFNWKVANKIECEFVYQTFSDVADIKGMDVIAQNSSSISVCVFGKGIEVFNIPTART